MGTGASIRSGPGSGGGAQSEAASASASSSAAPGHAGLSTPTKAPAASVPPSNVIKIAPWRMAKVSCPAPSLAFRPLKLCLKEY